MPRALVCILSETRSSALSWPTFKDHVIDALDAELALCISTPSSYDFPNPYWQFSRYRRSVREYADWGDAYDSIQMQLVSGSSCSEPLPDWRQLLNLPDHWLGGVKGPLAQPGAAAILIAMRWFLLQLLEDERLLDRYDSFIVTRSDYVWTAPHPPLSALDSEYLWIPDGEGYGGITDRHVVLPAGLLHHYLALIREILLSPAELMASMQAISVKWNIEMFILHGLSRAGCLDRIRVLPCFMYTVRPWGGGTSWSKGEWSDEHGYYIKYPHEYHASTSLTPFVRDTQDWRKILVSPSVELCFNAPLRTVEGRHVILNGDSFAVVAEPKAGDLILTVDLRAMTGHLSLAPAMLGQCGKQQIQAVAVDPDATDSSRFAIQSLTDRRFFVVQDARLKLCDARAEASLFMLGNRYQATLHWPPGGT